MKYTLDAQDKKVGRIASEAAKILLGKDQPTFARNTLSENTVEIINASKVNLSEKKVAAKAYKFFSGFAGGLREEGMARTIEKKGIGEVFRIAIYGMLPKNKLRSKMIQNVTIKE